MRVVVPVIAAGALLVTPSAEAKLGLSLAVAPAQPIAGQPARVRLHAAGATVSTRHGLVLTAVSAWRGKHGQTFFEVPLVRTGPRTLRATIRFPHRGRWALFVPNEPSAGWMLRVRPAGSARAG